MAIAAQRFKFLDFETNVPIPDLKEITENAVFNIPDITPENFELPSNEELKSLLESLEEMSANALQDIDLNSIVDKAMSAFENLELPDLVKDALDFLKNLDFSSLKNFFSDVLDIGMSFLCNNLDFLKLFLLGFALSGDVLAGLLIAFLLSLLDRICDSYLSKDRIENTSKKDILDNLLPIKNNITNSDIAFSEFKQCMGDMEFISSLENTSSSFDTSGFLSSIISNTKEGITNIVDSLSGNSTFFSSKNSVLDEINNSLSNFIPGSKEYNNLLFTKGLVSVTPSFSPNTSLANIMKDNLSLSLGKLAKSLPSIEINPIKQLGLDNIEKSLFDKFIEFKQITITEQDIFKNRELNSSSFINIDFGGLLPSITSEISNYLKNTTKPSSQRWRGISPTTEVIFDDYITDSPELLYT